MKIALITLIAAAALSACSNDADVVSANISQAADNFEVNRRVIFYNGITGEYILTIEGLCSLDAVGYPKVTITCKVGPTAYKKHYLGVSNNVTYFIEQLESVPADPYHYRVTFKPSVIIPDIRLPK